MADVGVVLMVAGVLMVLISPLYRGAARKLDPDDGSLGAAKVRAGVEGAVPGFVLAVVGLVLIAADWIDLSNVVGAVLAVLAAVGAFVAVGRYARAHPDSGLPGNWRASEPIIRLDALAQPRGWVFWSIVSLGVVAAALALVSAMAGL